MREHTWVRVMEITEPAGSIWKCTACDISVWSTLCPTVSSFLNEKPNLVVYNNRSVGRASKLSADCNELIALRIIEK